MLPVRSRVINYRQCHCQPAEMVFLSSPQKLASTRTKRKTTPSVRTLNSDELACEREYQERVQNPCRHEPRFPSVKGEETYF